MRDLKMRGRRRQGKRRLKSEFAFSIFIAIIAIFVKCMRILLVFEFLRALYEFFEKNEKKNKTTSVYRLFFVRIILLSPKSAYG